MSKDHENHLVFLANRGVDWLKYARVALLSCLSACFLFLMLVRINIDGWGPGLSSQSQANIALPLSVFVPIYTVLVATGFLSGYLFRGRFVRALIMVGLVYSAIGFWPLHSPWGSYDDLSKYVNVVVINQGGHIFPNSASANYQGFPGAFVLQSVLSEVSGILGLSSLIPLLLAFLASLTLFVYVLICRVLGDNFRAFLATFIFFEGNVVLANYQFHPDLIMVYTVVAVMFLLLLPFRRSNYFLLAGFGLAAVTGDFISSLMVLLALILFLIMARFQQGGTTRILTMVISYVIIFASWGLFWSYGTTVSLLAPLFSGLRGSSSHVVQIFSANAAAPFWVTGTKLFWVGFTVAMPVLVLAYFVLGKHPVNKIQFSLLSASTLAEMLVFTSGGGVNFNIAFIYAPIATIPLIFLVSRRTLYIVGIAVLAVSLSAVTFLAFNNQVLAYTYPPEASYSGQFLVSYTDAGQNFYGNPSSVLDLRPTSNIFPAPQTFTATSSIGAQAVTSTFSMYISGFRINRNSIFISNPAEYYIYFHLYGTTIGYKVLNASLDLLGQNDLTYSDGYSQAYYSGG